MKHNALFDGVRFVSFSPKCFAMWMAGGGIKPGISIGETDDYCYNVVEDSVPIHDLQATILNRLGVDHTKLTFKFQGRDFG